MAPQTGENPAAAPASSTPPPRLQLAVQTMEETTGVEFGITAPMLLLHLRNPGPGPAAVPNLGVDMLLSLEVVLHGVDRPAFSERRRVTLRLPWTVSLQQLAPDTEVVQGLSPLSRDQRDVPLALGRYQAQVCVLAPAQATYPSSFTQTYGGSCSNQLDITIARRSR